MCRASGTPHVCTPPQCLWQSPSTACWASGWSFESSVYSHSTAAAAALAGGLDGTIEDVEEQNGMELIRGYAHDVPMKATPISAADAEEVASSNTARYAALRDFGDGEDDGGGGGGRLRIAEHRKELATKRNAAAADGNALFGGTHVSKRRRRLSSTSSNHSAGWSEGWSETVWNTVSPAGSPVNTSKDRDIAESKSLAATAAASVVIEDGGSSGGGSSGGGRDSGASAAGQLQPAAAVPNASPKSSRLAAIRRAYKATGAPGTQTWLETELDDAGDQGVEVPPTPPPGRLVPTDTSVLQGAVDRPHVAGLSDDRRQMEAVQAPHASRNASLTSTASSRSDLLQQRHFLGAPAASRTVVQAADQRHSVQNVGIRISSGGVGRGVDAGAGASASASGSSRGASGTG